MVTYPYAYMTYILSPLAGLGGGHIVVAARLQLVFQCLGYFNSSFNVIYTNIL